MRFKICKQCGSEMRASPPCRVTNMSRKDWHDMKCRPDSLQCLLPTMRKPVWDCLACIEQGRKEIREGKFYTPEECLAHSLGCTVEEALEEIEKHKRARGPDDGFIAITIEDVGKALEELS